MSGRFFNPHIGYNNPNINYNNQHPNMQHPNMMHPSMMHPSMMHPGMHHPSMMHPGMNQNPMMHPNMNYNIPHPSMMRPNMPVHNMNGFVDTRFSGHDFRQHMHQQVPNLNISANTNFDDNRFGSSTFKTEEVPVEQGFNNVPIFELSNISGVTFKDCENLKLPVNIPDANGDSIISFEDIFILDCFEEAVEGIIERSCKFNKESNLNSKVTVNTVIIIDKTYNITIQEYIKDLFNKDILEIYKLLNKYYKESTTKYEIVLFNKINTMLTSIVNEFLYINTIERITIDSFKEDFIELIKILKTKDQNTESIFLLYLTKYLDNYKDNLDTINRYIDDGIAENEKCDNYSYICEEKTFIYLDHITSELGLNNFNSETYVYLPKKSTNKSLINLVDYVMRLKNINNIVLVTIEKETFNFYKSEQDDMYLRKIV